MSSLRYRGIEVVVDTLHSAEIEIQGYQISDDQLENAAENLSKTPFSPRDLVAGDLRCRELNGYNYFFFVASEGTKVVVTIGQVSPASNDKSEIEKIFHQLGKVAIVRGTLGV